MFLGYLFQRQKTSPEKGNPDFTTHSRKSRIYRSFKRKHPINDIVLFGYKPSDQHKQFSFLDHLFKEEKEKRKGDNSPEL